MALINLKLDQKTVSAIGVAVAGALGALAASDTVSPQVAAYCALAVIILGSFGIHAVPVTEKKQTQILAAANLPPADSLPPQQPPPGTRLADPPPRSADPPPPRGLP